MANRVTRRVSAAKGSKAGAHMEPLPSDLEVTLHGAPSYYASGFQVALAGNDASLTFNRNLLGHASQDGEMVNVAKVTPVVEVSVSMGTLKDISLVVQKVLTDYEAEFGEVETAFTRMRAAEKTS